MIKAIIFDCFGVIITDALQALSGQNPDKSAKISELIGRANRGLADAESTSRQIAELLGVTPEEYRQTITKGEYKDLELLKYIKDLKKNYKIGLLSNIPSGRLGVRFTDQELKDHFDVVVVSGDIGYAKPEPQAYEITAERLGVRLDECVFIDDRAEYCLAAQSIGMQTFVYENLNDCKKKLAQILQ